MSKPLISIRVLIRWILTLVLILAINQIGKDWLIYICIIASIFCELYWYLWQTEKVKRLKCGCYWR